jgi:transcriptional regulator with XRE-family HTH domain
MRKKRKIDAKAVIVRIKMLREKQYGNRGKSKFARDLGISVSTYNYYEKNRLPDVDVLVRICEVTGARLEWLILGESACENRFLENQRPPRSRDEAQTDFSKSEKGKKLLEKMNRLLESDGNAFGQVVRFIDLLLEKARLEEQMQTPDKSIASNNTQSFAKSKDAGELNKNRNLFDNQSGLIPILGRTAAGMVHLWDDTTISEKGTVSKIEDLVLKHTGRPITKNGSGEIVMHSEAKPKNSDSPKLHANLVQVNSWDIDSPVEFLQCREIYLKYPDCFALQIDGDSMSPRIKDGDIVILSASVSAGEGQLCVAKIKGQIGVTCKIIRTTENSAHLVPINETYQTKVVNKDDLLWSLAVLGCFRKQNTVGTPADYR